MSGTGAGVRRAAMAADQFTQIANGLFRDSRLSYRAKGVFGCISTHATGWHVTIADLVRAGPDGRDAVRAALAELELHGYLVREQVRHGDGTLGEIVYSITDRPAETADTPARADGPVFVPAPADGVRPGFGAGIRRGVMAADRFTQIANGLFRDSRLSFKAKGLFGLVSTHRDGWRVSVTDLTRCSPDGAAAVRSGLSALQEHGFLQRERVRNPDGTLGGAAYVLTDLPALESRRSRPLSGYPPVDEPTSVHRTHKKTMSKKTNKQNTSPLRPCAAANATTPQDPPAPEASKPRTEGPVADELHPGIRLLLELGAERPEFLLTGQTLTDQGRVVTVMLEAGWTCEHLRHVIAGRPLPQPVRTSVGAIVAARLRAAQAYPPPAHSEYGHHHEHAFADEPPTGPATGRSSTAAARTVTEALAYRALVECAGCGAPATAPGEDLCPACLDWPLCRTCPGPTPRRAHPAGDGRCTTCATVTAHPPDDAGP
ncbi:hypothetical protein [Streptomyces sp. NPDC005017]|uniref:hypothetical protein n=1 Tax=Streptomyces sp. NPDC005017 TaxID=3364706 RepID=UPI003699C49D